jgi:dolichol-phosphate mannosyltransferase
MSDFGDLSPLFQVRNPQSTTLVALATYNEIGNLPSLVDAIEGILPEADVLVVDDNSPDGTGKWCYSRAITDSRLKYVHRPRKLGLGSATLDAMRFALSFNYDVLVTMDADWSHDPQYLPNVVEATERADVVLGSRYCVGGAIEGWPLRRRILSRGMNWLSRLLLRLPIRDSSGAFRAYRVAALRKIDLACIRSTGYSYLEEILWHLHRSGAEFVEVPITFRERRAGRSKISAREVYNKVSTLLRLYFVRN